MSWRGWSILILCLGIPVLAYVLNLSGTATADPTARLVGVKTYRIPSTSMTPTLRERELILVRTWAYSRQAPERGEVVVFDNPAHPGVAFVFRVIALGGETIQVREDAVLVEGAVLSEPYLPDTVATTPTMHPTGLIQVPEDAVFVLGDNRNNAMDSRFIGPIPRKNLIGRVSSIWWSPHGDGRLGEVR